MFGLVCDYWSLNEKIFIYRNKNLSAFDHVLTRKISNLKHDNKIVDNYNCPIIASVNGRMISYVSAIYVIWYIYDIFI